jgi:hypothetical protein
MPYQNRVTPEGALIATSARGTLMGNRGCIHDERKRIVRTYQLRRWIICLLEFKGRWRAIMSPGKYTELFFLDEATALAAGHRPCAECQRERFTMFRAHWAAANPARAGSTAPAADAIDSALHRERISGDHYHRDKVKLAYADPLDTLPDGAFVVLDASDTPYLVHGDALYPWSFEGYGLPVARPAGIVAKVLTPRSTVRALAHGYRAEIHPSAPEIM